MRGHLHGTRERVEACVDGALEAAANNNQRVLQHMYLFNSKRTFFLLFSVVNKYSFLLSLLTHDSKICKRKWALYKNKIKTRAWLSNHI